MAASRSVSSWGAVCALGLALGAALAGCASGFEEERYPPREASHFGNYLAARYADAVHENEAATEFYAKALEEDPGNPVIVERAFLQAVTAGDMDRALDFADEIITRAPRERTARLLLGLNDLRANAYQEAISQFDQAAPGPFTALVGTLATSWAHAGRNEKEKALEGTSSFSGRPAFDLFRFYHEALMRDYLQDVEGADKAYLGAVEASGGASLRVVQAYGNFLERRDRHDEARDLYQRYADLAPNHPVINKALELVAARKNPAPMIPDPAAGVAEALYGLGSALAQENGIDISIVYLQLALFLRPEFDVARTLLADIYEMDGRWEEAIVAYKSVSPRSALYENSRIQAAVALDRLDRPGQARAVLREIANSMPEAIEPVVALGDIARGRDEFAVAVRHYTKAIEMTGAPGDRHWSLFYARGICYERLGKWSDAERDLKVALRLSDEHPLVLNYLGYSWVDQKIHLDEAMEMIRKAVDLRPNDGFIVDSLGWAHYRLGEYEKATEYLERAVVLQPDDPTINDHLGDALWRVGRRVEARFQWRHALELKPEEKFVGSIKDKLANGLKDGSAAAAQNGDPAPDPNGS